MKPLNQAAIAVAVATLATVAGAQETHNVINYLNLLDSNAVAREAHVTSPIDSMSQFGLNAAEQSAFLSGDKVAVAKLAAIGSDVYGDINVTNTDLTYAS